MDDQSFYESDFFIFLNSLQKFSLHMNENDGCRVSKTPKLFLL